MQMRPLGNSDILLTPIGFGSWAAGGGNWEYAWGPQDDAESVAAIQHALDLGVNWIDTAAVYGLGHSEEVVAKAIQGRAQKPYVFTKCGLVWGPDRRIGNSLKRDSVRRECEASLKRLRVDAIDLYQIHWPFPDGEIEEGIEAIAELRAEGKVRFIGVSNFDVRQIQRAQKIAPITSLQPPYSAVRPEAERELLPFCEQQGIGVIAYSPMQAGLLTGAMTRERIAHFAQDDWRRHNDNFKEPRLTRNLVLQSILADIGERHGVAAAAVAVAWVLRRPAVTAAIVGARRPAQVDGFIPALEFRLSREETEEIAAFLARHP